MAYVVSFELDDELPPGDHSIGIDVKDETNPNVRFVSMAAPTAIGEGGADQEVGNDLVVLPDTDGDGVADVVEVAIAEHTGKNYDPTDASTKPEDENEVKEAFKALGEALVVTVKEQLKAERAVALAEQKGVDVSKLTEDEIFDLVDNLSEDELAEIEDAVTKETETFTQEVQDAAAKADLTPPTTLQVKAVDGNGNPIASGSTTASGSITFAFTCNEAACAFQCSLDAGAFKSCSKVLYSGLVDGAHEIRVKATDSFGNSEKVPKVFTWTVKLPVTKTAASECGNGVCEAGEDAASCPADCKTSSCGNGICEPGEDTASCVADCPVIIDTSTSKDTTPPDTSFAGAGLPALLTNQTSATFEFSCSDTSNEQRATGNEACTFECSLDSAPFSACSSPFTVGAGLPALSDGSHTFTVQAIDAAGNVDSTPATFTWTIDATAPDTTVTCATPTGGSCPSSLNATSYKFTVTTTSTTVVVTETTSGNKVTGTCNETSCTFECSLDAAAFAACTGLGDKTLADGLHKLEIRAMDAIGNVDITPGSVSWTIDSTGPAAIAGFSASGGNRTVSVSWNVTTDDPSGIKEYQLLYGTATGTYTGTGAAEGNSPITIATTSCSATSCSKNLTTLTNCQTYFLKVVAVDGLGNATSTSETSAATTIPAPTGVTATSGQVGKIPVSFTGVANASGYQVKHGYTTGSYSVTSSTFTGTSYNIAQEWRTVFAVVVAYDGSTCNSVDSSEVSGTPKGFTFFTSETEVNANIKFGSALAVFPDINANSKADWIVGIPGCPGSCLHVYDTKAAGQACTTTANSCNVMTIGSGSADGIEGHPIGPGGGSGFGTDLDAGDVDGDGKADWLIGMPNVSQIGCQGTGAGTPDWGGWEVLKGSTATILGTKTCAAAVNDKMGSSVAIIGDILGADGKFEFAAGVPGAQKVHVYSWNGSSFAQMSYSPLTLALTGFGSAVEGGGDVNGDGTRDIIVGISAEFISNSNGGVRVYSGATGAVIYAKGSDFNTPSLNGVGALHTVEIIGDVTGDGKAEFAYGLPWTASSGSTGNVLVHSGADGSVLYSLSGENINDQFGATVAEVGDLDGDSKNDFAVGAINWKDGATAVGRVYVYSGAAGSLIGSYSPGTAGGLESGSQFGAAIAGGLDLDGDGVKDIIAGAPNDAAGASGSGNTFIFSFK